MSEPDALPPGQVLGPGGAVYMPRADGAMVPIETVKEKDRVQDQMVRDLFAEAVAQSDRLAAFKAKAFADTQAMLRLLEEKYKAKGPGGAKGNTSWFSYDGLMRIQIQVADLIRFGPELQVAKALLEECVSEWVEGARAELRVIVMDAFRKDKAGEIRTGAVLALRRYEIEDERWKRAMEAIADSIIVLGSKSYIRFSHRPHLEAPWENVSLDIATA